MKRTYILGAGFSKEINDNYPVLNDLTEMVYENLIDKYKGNPILEYFNQLPKEIVSNVEALLSYLSINWPWKDAVEKYLDLALYTALEEQIISVFRSIICKEIDNTYIEFIKIITDRYYNIITLNYDTLVEEIAKKNNLMKNGIYCGHKITIEDEYDEDKLLDEDIKFKFSKEEIRIKRMFLTTATDKEIDDIFIKHIGHPWTSTSPSNWLQSAIKPGYGEKPSIIKLHGTLANEFTEKGIVEKIIPPTLDKTNILQMIYRIFGKVLCMYYANQKK